MAKKNNINPGDLSTWPILMTMVIGVLVAGAVFFLVNQFFISDIDDTINSRDSEISQQESDYAKNKQTVATLPQIEKEVENLQKVRDEAKKYLPTDVSMPDLIDNVYLAAKENGIVFNSFVPGKNIEKKYYTIKPISLNANIGYLSMASFIQKVTSLKRIMNVHSVSFSSDKGYSKDKDKPLKMSATLRTYIFKNAKK